MPGGNSLSGLQSLEVIGNCIFSAELLPGALMPESNKEGKNDKCKWNCMSR